MSKVVLESGLWAAILLGEMAAVIVVMVRTPRSEFADDPGHSWAGPGWAEPLTAPLPAVAAAGSPAARHASPAAAPAALPAGPALPAPERYRPRHGEPAISGQPPWPPAPRPPGLAG
jgi:hypothetical protein